MMRADGTQAAGLVDVGSGLEWPTCPESHDVAPMQEGDAEKMSDEELLGVLEELGIAFDRAAFDEIVADSTSSDEVFQRLTEASGAQVTGYDQDDAMYCLIELCHRWHPGWVSTDNLDDLMQEGYDAFGPHTAAYILPGIEIWERAWEMVKALRRKWRVRTVDEFDDRFWGVQSLHNWAQDLELEYLNVAFFDLGDERAHDDFVRDFAREFPEDVQRVLGFWVDDDGTLVKQIIDEEGDWPLDEPWDEDGSPAFGWISSADPDPFFMPTTSSEPKREPIRVQKVGRNDPCPCGSGKKYKKCCGRL